MSSSSEKPSSEKASVGNAAPGNAVPGKAVRKSRVISRPGGLLPSASLLVDAGPTRPAEWSAVPTSMEHRLEQARQAGFADGHRAGLEEAMATAEGVRLAAASRAADRLAAAAADVGEQRAAVVAELVTDVVGLAFELLEILVGREAALSDAPARDAVVRALALAPEGDDLLVRVHPDSGIGVAEIEQLAADPRVTVIHDPDVEAGGCLVSVGPCHIDAQIAPALARVRACLESLTPPAVGPAIGRSGGPTGRPAGAPVAAPAGGPS
jgi:flagellar assembly protein FliH